MSLYAYCLSDEVAARMVEDVTGVSDATPRLLRCGEEISAVVSDFEGAAASVTRENVFAHERVIQRVLRHTTPLPFRFGTLVSREQLETYVDINRDRLVKSLGHLRDSVEMSVKIIWNAEEVRHAGARAEHDGARSEDEQRGLGKGAAYLAARQRELLGDAQLKERAEEVAAWLEGRVGEAAKERDVHVRSNESLVVRAAFLVQRARLSDYQKRVEVARDERSDLRFLTSGPWPPYSFTNINP